MDCSSQTLLHEPSKKGDEHVAELPLQHSVTTNAADGRYRTPLHRAVAVSQQAVPWHLAAFGATLYSICSKGETALLLACFGDGEVFYGVLQHGSDVLAPNHDADTLIDLASVEWNSNPPP